MQAYTQRTQLVHVFSPQDGLKLGFRLQEITRAVFCHPCDTLTVGVDGSPEFCSPLSINVPGRDLLFPNWCLMALFLTPVELSPLRNGVIVTWTDSKLHTSLLVASRHKKGAERRLLTPELRWNSVWNPRQAFHKTHNIK